MLDRMNAADLRTLIGALRDATTHLDPTTDRVLLDWSRRSLEAAQAELDRRAPATRRADNLRAVVASVSDKLDQMLSDTKIDGRPVKMNQKCEDELAKLHAALTIAIEDDDREREKLA